MSEFAKIENSVVTQIIVATSVFIAKQPGSFVDVTNLPEKPGIGWSYVGSTFTKPSDIASTANSLNISLSSSNVSVNTLVTASVSVTDPSGGVLLLTQVYYVPIIRDSDGKQAEFIQIDLLNGVGSVVFSLAEKGKYTIDMSKITPLPTSILLTSPVIIVI